MQAECKTWQSWRNARKSHWKLFSQLGDLPEEYGSAMTFVVVLIGLCAGIMVGLLGIGGGIVLVPALVYLLHMDQHLAQGTSLFVLLPPIGLGALLEYRKKGDVDIRAGILCAIGMLIGGYLGGLIAVPMSSNHLKELFGAFLMLSAALLWGKASRKTPSVGPVASTQGGS